MPDVASASSAATAAAPATPAKRIGPLFALFPFLRPYAGRWALAFAALVTSAGATLALPVAFKYLIDRGFASGDRTHIDRYFVALFIVSLVLAGTTALRFYLVSWLGERVTADLRRSVYDHVMRMSPQFFETAQTGEVLSRLTTDTTLIQTVVGTSLSLGLRNFFLMTGGVGMLVVTSPVLSGYIIATLVVVVAPIVLFGRRVRRLSRASQDKVANASALAGEVLNAMPTVQSYTQETFEARRFGNAVEAAFDTALTRIRARAWLTAVVIVLVFAAIVFVLWLGAQAVLAGRMTAGQLSQFILYAVFTAGAVGAVAEVWGDLQRAAGATERLLQLLASRSPVVEAASTVPLPARGDGIRFDGVSFSYPSRPGIAALAGFSLDVREGEHVALVGPSGAGKTTVFQLLMRFYDPQAGDIVINGVSTRQASFADLRHAIGVVLQESVIFSGSVLDNIRYGTPDATLEQVRRAAAMAAADGFIDALPEGYDTFLGERGVRLSGGQRQRIAIARAILKNPPILLLDEATSALDAASERLVQTALDNAAQNRTTLVIAHRLATVQQADRIVVMEQGRIVAQGRHAELLRSSPLYAQLAALQFGEWPKPADEGGAARDRVDSV
ncbi:ABC transporter transmembrane domain-containing protein [Paraburkholderia caballeronis]|uniref:ATP-binding cassette, subfamily B n=1 Tax=Paraburkholderia caballeronis TaxID=416943 RepID=A0A1H7TCP2_9BURK|nr:ABC transporter transmembrane domain-containing protein [Paraburkholderia caballeronis]PXW22625.1 ATP-binding cassette subfamily B protein [Paraburkholderia caballeronis]PXW96728.1 ATP-binding cassette subfamily B protein [Paraburkholderia caballeronis]RAJ93355.1 ATP-binding cassette subfamily B protein [Paraburkholderia caballeronis]SEC67430.1 ATP-binding cassette, subfamily B [Paraburkholderia caballeronis]SEL82066.1 ATP-binding cassette, subfamily B [Paraburkholderia caballeronis]